MALYYNLDCKKKISFGTQESIVGGAVGLENVTARVSDLG